MKELLIGFGNYNKRVNGIVYGLIGKIDPDRIEYSIKAYYPNIGETIIHVLRSDLKWLKRLSVFRECVMDGSPIDACLTDGRADGAKIVANLAVLSAFRTEVDSAIISLVEGISESGLASPFEIQFGTKPVTIELWKLLLQWFNHQTHHRGMVSMQLELVGMDNDFALMLDKMD